MADYLLWLWEVSSVKAHHSILSAVIWFKLPELGDHHVLQNLIRSLAIERPRRPQFPPSWNLRSLTKKTLYFVTLTTAKKAGKLQALSRVVSSVGDDLVVSYLPHFVAKTERADAPLPRSFCVRSLGDFSGDLEEGSLLCPVDAFRAYLVRTKSAVTCVLNFVCVSSFSISCDFEERYFVLPVRSYFWCWGCQRRQRPSPESPQHS